jgi:hypothetical protein
MRSIRAGLGTGFNHASLQTFTSPHELLQNILVTVGGGHFSSYMNAKKQAEKITQTFVEGQFQKTVTLSDYTGHMNQTFEQIDSLAQTSRGQAKLADYEKVYYHMEGLAKRFDLFRLHFEPRMIKIVNDQYFPSVGIHHHGKGR